MFQTADQLRRLFVVIRLCINKIEKKCHILKIGTVLISVSRKCVCAGRRNEGSHCRLLVLSNKGEMRVCALLR